MNVPARRTGLRAADFRLGQRITARPPSVSGVLRGWVVGGGGYTLTIETIDGMLVLVDVEDCTSAARAQTKTDADH